MIKIDRACDVLSICLIHVCLICWNFQWLAIKWNILILVTQILFNIKMIFIRHFTWLICDCCREWLAFKTMVKIYEYFNWKYVEWEILDFLTECEERHFKKKIDVYVKSLKNIIKSNMRKTKREKACTLLDRYKKASKEVFRWKYGENK